MGFDVIVIGATAVDVKGRAAQPLASGSSVPGRIRVSEGGVARNVAENLGRLGVATALLSAVGDDADGRRLLERTASGGVATEYVVVSPSHHTGAYMVVMDPQGQVIYSLDDMGVIEALTPTYIRQHRDLIRQAAWIALDANVPLRTMEAIFQLAKKGDVRICADPTSVSLASRLVPYMDRLAMVTPNVPEAEALTGRSIRSRDDALHAAMDLVRMGVGVAVVTLAEKGACYATAGESGHIPALQREVVDLTGAGDALTAAVLFGLLNDLPVGEAVRLGISAAALTLQCEDTVYPELSLERLYDELGY